MVFFSLACPARTPLRPTVYPTPVWGTAGVPCYGAGPFVPSGYRWTARTTELHPDGECKHGPPRGETPEEGTRASVKDPPPPPPTQPHRTPARARVGPGKAPGEQRPKRRGKEKEGGGHAKGAAGEHTTTNRLQPGVAGNHTRAPQPGRGRRHDTQPQHPHSAAKPRPERRGQVPKRTTNTPHTRPRAHTT